MDNEGKCCDAVLRILEQQHQTHRANVQRDTASNRGVEIVCNIGKLRYALEHTLIEPFPENQRDNIAFRRVFDDAFESEVRDALRGDLAYSTYVDVYAFKAFKARRLSDVRQELIAWIRASVSRLPEPEGFPQVSLHAKPPDTPVPIRLACHRSKGLGGRLLPGRFAPRELEHLRRKRLLKALQDKSPKLHTAKLPGTLTILVLENSDIALTNEGLVSETIDTLAPQISHMPDDDYIVDTSICGRFYVTQVRRQGQMCLDVGPEDRRWDFDGASLSEI
jgi:hypothetical protein